MTYTQLLSFIGSKINYGYGPEKITSVFETPCGFRFATQKLPIKPTGHGWINWDSVVQGPFMVNP